MSIYAPKNEQIRMSEIRNTYHFATEKPQFASSVAAEILELIDRIRPSDLNEIASKLDRLRLLSEEYEQVK